MADALGAVVARAGRPDWKIVWIFVLGTVLMRSAGCAVNDYADRHYDRHVTRTRDRPLAAGIIRPTEALIVAAVLALVAFALVLPLNPLTINSPSSPRFLAVIYPFTKRFFALPQAYLGVAFGFGIPMAFAAQHEHVPGVAWVLLLANIFWAIAYDTEYAMVDRDDDRRIGIRTSALTFGRFDVAAVMICHAAFLAMLAWSRRELTSVPPYYAGLASPRSLMRLAIRADPRPRAAALLPRLPAQQLGGCGRLRRHPAHSTLV